MDTSSEPEVSAKPSFLKEAWDFIKVLVIAAIAVMLLRYFVAQPFIVKGSSMEPNFLEKNYLIIDELSYYLGSPERGQVVVFHFPFDETQYFIKRIIGLPGETVGIRGGKVFIQKNPNALETELKESYLPKGLETLPDIHQTLGANEYFVMGDNRADSFDSRKWGVLPKKELTGRVLFRIWPFSHAGLIQAPSY